MSPSREDRSAEQSVEIVVALAAGALVFVAVLLVGWLVGGALLGATTAAWGKPALWMGCVLGAAAVLWRLFCVRRNSGL